MLKTILAILNVFILIAILIIATITDISVLPLVLILAVISTGTYLIK
jgi:hypothetical protein